MTCVTMGGCIKLEENGDLTLLKGLTITQDVRIRAVGKNRFSIEGGSMTVHPTIAANSADRDDERWQSFLDDRFGPLPSSSADSDRERSRTVGDDPMMRACFANFLPHIPLDTPLSAVVVLHPGHHVIKHAGSPWGSKIEPGHIVEGEIVASGPEVGK